MLTGILAAELLVKNAVIPLSFRQRMASGQAFLFSVIDAIDGLTTSAVNSMHPTSSPSSFPYVVKMASPLSETFVNTIPQIPNGARLMIHRTAFETASEMSFNACLVVGEAAFVASPRTTAQKRIPIYFPSEIAATGFAIILIRRFLSTSKYEDRRNRLQGADEQVTEKTDDRKMRCDKSENCADYEADRNAQNETGAVVAFDN